MQTKSNEARQIKTLRQQAANLERIADKMATTAKVKGSMKWEKDGSVTVKHSTAVPMIMKAAKALNLPADKIMEAILITGMVRTIIVQMETGLKGKALKQALLRG